MTMTPALQRLLDAEAGFAPEFGGGLANHRPMALHALARLGADDARLEAFARQYEPRLAAAEPPQPWPAGMAWADRLGQPGAWPLYRDLFAQWLYHESPGEMLPQVLPRLMLGAGGAGFHGLIRTAHAVAAGHRAELRDALAAWAACWLPLGQAQPDARPTTDDPEVLLRQLRVVRAGRGLIVDGLRAAAQSRGFDALCARLALGPGTLPQLARLAAKAYAASGNFAVLHLVTSALAMHELMRFLDPEEPEKAQAALAAYWRAFAATVSSAGIVPLPPLAPPPWAQLVQAACASDDDHAIKLVDACVQWHAVDPGGPWQAAAARALAG
ncbi:MAG: questin oxidase family protein [Betaproteobacteria bacterium]